MTRTESTTTRPTPTLIPGGLPLLDGIDLRLGVDLEADLPALWAVNSTPSATSRWPSWTGC